MKYYKIVDPDGHQGLIYKEGINTDPLPFKPWGICEAGGLYFSREDILAFVDYGTELYEVEPIGEVYEDPQNYSKKWKAHSIKLTYVGKVLDNIQFLIEQGANIHADEDHPLRLAAENGYLETVKYLVEQGANIHTQDNYPLRYAARKGHLDVVKYLVEQGANVNVCYGAPLCWAAENGHLDLVKYLVEQGADIHVCNDYILRYIVMSGFKEVAEYIKSKKK